jgi:type I restriction enzyme S subunit
LFAGSGETKQEIGKCAAFISDEVAYAGGDVIVLTPRNCDSLFLGFLLNHSMIAIQKAQNGQGDAVVHIYPNALSRILIPLPPTLAEQTAIATALSDADALINQLEQLLTKKRNIKTGAMQELLSPKEGWVVEKLGNLFNITAGGDFRKDLSSEVHDERYPFPIYSNSLQNQGAYGFSTYYTNEANCITVTARGTIGYSCFRNHRFTAIGRLLVLVPKCDYDCYYFSEYINNKVEFALEVTGVPQLTAPQISRYEVSFPYKKAEQTRIAQILSDMDNEIEEMEKQLEKYKMLKQGMMQNLLTGKIRLV